MEEGKGRKEPVYHIPKMVFIYVVEYRALTVLYALCGCLEYETCTFKEMGMSLEYLK